MAEKRFLEDAFLPDGTPNIPSQAYADYLETQSMTPRADPVGYVAPPPDNREKILSNYGFDAGNEYLSAAGQQFKNAATGQGVATMLPEMAFYPGGPTGLEKVYGGIADTGLGLLSTIVSGLGYGAGFVAEQMPFQNENDEDRLSRDLLGGVEFAEQYLTPYFGLFTKLGRASKVATAANRLPVARVEDAVEIPEFGALAAQQQQAQEFDELLENIDFEEIEDAVDPDFIPVEDIRIDPTQPMNIVDTTPAPFSMLDFDERMRATQGDITPTNDDMLLDAILNPTAAERLEEGFRPIDEVDDIVDYEMVPDDNILDDAAEAADEAARAAEKIDREQLRAILFADTPITSINEAVNTEQLRELYASYNLPIPKNNAEELAANIIIESNNKKIADSQIGNLPPTQRQSYDAPEDFRQGADLDYLKAHAPADVYNKQGPTMLEAKLTEQQEGRLGTLPPINSGNDGPRIAPEFYSQAVQAARHLESMGNVKSASYPELKRLMLKMKGVKIKELEWSGADEAFEGRKDVTPQELVEYLEDNTNLIEAKTIEGGIDYSGDIRVLEERYVDRKLPALLEKEKENFIDEWEDDFPDIDKISDLNNQSLDEYAAQVDGVSNGQELAEKYPDGYIGQKEGNSLVPNGVTLVFNNAQKAAEYEWNNQGVDIAREELRGTLENEVEYAGYDVSESGKETYLAMLFPDGNPPNWVEDHYNSFYEAGEEPKFADLEYAEYFPKGGTNMRETTYQFRDPTGKLDDDYFREAHFGESNREENLVAHARTAEFPVEGGGRAYHLGEAQSDMQQGIRSRGTTPRTREQEVMGNEVESINRRIGNMVRDSENVLNQTIFNDNIGIATASRREQHPEKLETYRTIIADFLNTQYGNPDQSMIPQIRYDMDPEHTFFAKNRGNIEYTNSNLDAFAEYIINNENTVPTEYVTWADKHINDFSPEISNSYEKLVKFSNQDLSNQQVGAPFVESTDAWVDMVLRRQLADAIESGADYITLPNPRMVKDYTQGEFEGHRQFYGNIAPKNLLNIVKSADPTRNSAIELFPVRIQTEAGLEDVLALPLTPGLIQSLRQKGLPNYMLPFTVGGAASYGTLGSITNDETTGGAI